VRRTAKYHDNDGETVESADAPRKRFGDTGDERKVGRATESRKDPERRRAGGRSSEEKDASTRSGSSTRTRR
jgi:hypothetical protein